MASRIEHFEGFSIVQGDIKIEVSLDRFSKQYADAQFWLDEEVMNSMEPFMPKVTGTLINRTKAENDSLAGSGLVCAAAGPYGRFLYEGKTMVDILTGSPWARKDAEKVLVSQYGGHTNTKEYLTYSKHANPNATDHWFDAAKERDCEEWVKGVKEIAGGG